MVPSSQASIKPIAKHAIPPNASFPEGTGVYYIPNFVTVRLEVASSLSTSLMSDRKMKNNT